MALKADLSGGGLTIEMKGALAQLSGDTCNHHSISVKKKSL